MCDSHRSNFLRRNLVFYPNWKLQKNWCQNWGPLHFCLTAGWCNYRGRAAGHAGQLTWLSPSINNYNYWIKQCSGGRTQFLCRTIYNIATHEICTYKLHLATWEETNLRSMEIAADREIWRNFKTKIYILHRTSSVAERLRDFTRCDTKHRAVSCFNWLQWGGVREAWHSVARWGEASTLSKHR